MKKQYNMKKWIVEVELANEYGECISKPMKILADSENTAMLMAVGKFFIDTCKDTAESWELSNVRINEWSDSVK